VKGESAAMMFIKSNIVYIPFVILEY